MKITKEEVISYLIDCMGYDQDMIDNLSRSEINDIKKRWGTLIILYTR